MTAGHRAVVAVLPLNATSRTMKAQRTQDGFHWRSYSSTCEADYAGPADSLDDSDAIEEDKRSESDSSRDNLDRDRNRSSPVGKSSSVRYQLMF